MESKSERVCFFFEHESIENEKRRTDVHLFCPKSTINLTYLCYGETNKRHLFSTKKKTRQTTYKLGQTNI